MESTGNAYWEPGAPPRPIRGLFHTAEVYDVSDPHVFLGAEYQTNRCSGGNSPWIELCEENPEIRASSKNFSGLDMVVGHPYAVYDGIECNLGITPTDAERMLRESFDVKAEATTEGLIGQIIQNNSPHDSADLVDAVGYLEERLSGQYSGQGLLHMDRRTSVAADASGILQAGALDSTVQTINGTPVVLGRGYYGSSGGFIAATGRVAVLRGPLMVYVASQTVDQPMRVLAEQQFVLLIECLAEWATVVETP